MSETLKNCPFCGKEPLDDDGCAMCMTDDCALDQVHIEAAAWNRRAEPAAHRGDGEARWHNLLRAAQEHIQTAGSEDPDDWARTLFTLEAAVDAALRTRTPQDDVEGR